MILVYYERTILIEGIEMVVVIYIFPKFRDYSLCGRVFLSIYLFIYLALFIYLFLFICGEFCGEFY